ncbi:MAG: hypothetical protein ACFFAE_19695, partial [Candidatus Hodarchaeota archaeon]
FFLGAIVPLDILPKPAQDFGNIIPFTKATDALKLIMVKNVGFEDVLFQFLYVTFCGIGIFILGILSYLFYLRRL